MQFVDKKVKLFPNGEDVFVILTEPVIGADLNFYCLVGLDDAVRPVNVRDITFCEKLTNNESNDTPIEKFQPDWSIIKYDWLAMDGNGNWYTYTHKPTFLEEYCAEDSVWSDEGNGANCKVLHIKYVHPEPSRSLCYRP